MIGLPINVSITLFSPDAQAFVCLGNLASWHKGSLVQMWGFTGIVTLECGCVTVGMSVCTGNTRWDCFVDLLLCLKWIFDILIEDH